MENELAISVQTAIQMLVVAAVLSIVIVFISLGRGFSRNTVKTVDNIHELAYASELMSINDYGESLPVATIYVALEKNRGYINNISGTVYGISINSVDDLTGLYHKKVRCEVSLVDEIYDVVIKEE